MTAKQVDTMRVFTMVTLIAALIVNIGVIVTLAVTIEHKLDAIANIEMSHCQLIKQSLVLGVEQNRDSYDAGIYNRLLHNFGAIDCQT